MIDDDRDPSLCAYLGGHGAFALFSLWALPHVSIFFFQEPFFVWIQSAAIVLFELTIFCSLFALISLVGIFIGHNEFFEASGAICGNLMFVFFWIAVFVSVIFILLNTCVSLLRFLCNAYRIIITHSTGDRADGLL
jgi:hypothetical protein